MGMWQRAIASVRVEWALLSLEDEGGRERAAELCRKLGPQKRLWPAYLALVRGIRNSRSPQPRQFSLILHGVAAEGHNAPRGAAGFMRHYRVVAANADEALTFAREIEPQRAWAELALNEIKDEGPSPDELEGVIEASPTIWYESET